MVLTPLVNPISAAARGGVAQSASIVLGQQGFSSTNNGTSMQDLSSPFQLAFDSSGNLWVGDENNNRILEFKSPVTTGESASVVVGQTDFTSADGGLAQNRLFVPVGLTFDSSGNLWVADVGNHRVLEFKPPFSDGMNASLELGQPSGPSAFVSNSTSTGPAGLYAPVDLAFDSKGDLWVSDHFNSRVLEFKPPFTDGMEASTELGQANMTSVAAAFSTSASTLFGPNGITFDSAGNLWVADENSNRVLEFNASSLGSNGAPAALELGQTAGPSQFSSTVSDVGRHALGAPVGLAVDASGDLWVSDRVNNRVLEFQPPFSDGMNASNEVGQALGSGEFTQTVVGSGQTGLNNPLGVAFDSSGNLWVADQDNNRILEFGSGTSSSSGGGLGSSTTSASQTTASTGTTELVALALFAVVVVAVGGYVVVARRRLRGTSGKAEPGRNS